MDNSRMFLNELNRLYKETNETYHRLALHYGIADSVFWVLYALYESSQPYTQTDISEQWALSKQTVHSALKSLEQDAYIFLESAPENKKSRFIRLTQKGEELVSRIIAPIVEAETESYSELTAKERRLLLELSEKQLLSFRQKAEKIRNS